MITAKSDGKGKKMTVAWATSSEGRRDHERQQAARDSKTTRGNKQQGMARPREATSSEGK